MTVPTSVSWTFRPRRNTINYDAINYDVYRFHPAMICRPQLLALMRWLITLLSIYLYRLFPIRASKVMGSWKCTTLVYDGSEFYGDFGLFIFWGSFFEYFWLFLSQIKWSFISSCIIIQNGNRWLKSLWGFRDVFILRKVVLNVFIVFFESSKMEYLLVYILL